MRFCISVFGIVSPVETLKAGETIPNTEMQNKRVVVAAADLLDAISHVCGDNDIPAAQILAVNRTDKIVLTDAIFDAK